MNKFNKSKGFTLIELLIVISIIGILAAVIMASLSVSRVKAKEASITQLAGQMKNLIELDYSDYGNYANLTTNEWIQTPDDCDNYFINTYGQKAKEVCVKIIENEVFSTIHGDNYLYIGVQGSDPSKYSILVYLPSTREYLCMGSNNRSSIGGPYWTAPGCYADATL